jgi:hypothetical protein
MKSHFTRAHAARPPVVAVSLVLGVGGLACQSDALVSDGGVDGAAGCVSLAGGPCGGLIAHPCACAAGLECNGARIEGPGVCSPQASAEPSDAAVEGQARDAAVEAQGDDAATDAPADVAAIDGGGADAADEAATDGGCVSQQGGHCGSTGAPPCACASGLVCEPGDSGLFGLPLGNVAGTCAADASCTDAATCLAGLWDSTHCHCLF